MRLTAIALCVLVASPAAASFNDGNRALNICTPGPDYSASYCLGMVAGLYDGTLLWNGRQFCTSGNVTLGQVRDVFIQHLRSRPAERHWAASALMNNALVAAFPCR